MEGILLDGRHGRLWLCKKHEGHALGIILEERVDGRLVERLLLFREAQNLEWVDPDKTTVVFSLAVKTKGALEGTMHDIECDLCDAKRTWWMDKKITISMLALLYAGKSK
jgi:hypothetical protein